MHPELETVVADLAPEVRDLVNGFEARRWEVHKVTDRRVRFWCPCGGHEVWMPLAFRNAAARDKLQQHLLNTTCWEEEAS